MNWSGRRVLLTGHTGFKGSWLSLWLQQLGAELCGVALDPPTSANLYLEADVERGMRSVIADIRDIGMLKQTIAEHRPEIIFHLAAQSLVRSSYEDPLGTYSTNVMGTANLLEAVRHTDSVRAIVVITTDKCYENREWAWPYRETDRLGGYDPYSNSKACAELVVSAYRNSFFCPADFNVHGVAIASARAGNVIGGGDWAEDRLVPDIIRAFMNDRPVRIRNPRAIRPWQHVLEPLRGYLAIADSLYENGVANGEAWNFGPEQSDAQSVEWIVQELANIWGEGASWELAAGPQPHEAQNLKLDWSKAAARLGWRPELSLKDALAMTTVWYKAKLLGQDMRVFTNMQIEEYETRWQLNKTMNSKCSEVRG
ncbi:MAG: CDP-glucose 4,6-dehydratase [Terracidiphilus sp.]